MNRRSQLIIGVTLALLGVGAFALGLVEEESDVRYVADLHADPAAHHDGTYTLLAVPQPKDLVRHVDGEPVYEPNPDYDPTIQTVQHEEEDGTVRQTTYTLSAEGPDVDGVSTWTLRTVTRTPGSDDATVGPERSWTLDEPHHVFLIHGFQDENGDSPTALGIYRGTLRDPIQPKPSQFVGNVQAMAPDGQPYPDGIVVYDVQEYTAGCSSKFLPPEVAEEYDEDGDGEVD